MSKITKCPNFHSVLFSLFFALHFKFDVLENMTKLTTLLFVQVNVVFGIGAPGILIFVGAIFL